MEFLERQQERNFEREHGTRRRDREIEREGNTLLFKMGILISDVHFNSMVEIESSYLSF